MKHLKITCECHTGAFEFSAASYETEPLVGLSRANVTRGAGFNIHFTAKVHPNLWLRLTVMRSKRLHAALATCHLPSQPSLRPAQNKERTGMWSLWWVLRCTGISPAPKRQPAEHWKKEENKRKSFLNPLSCLII